MRQRLTSWLETLIEHTARHVRALLVVLGLFLLIFLIVQGDAKLRNDLSYALATASAQLSPLLVAYDTAGEFQAHEVLELNRPETQQAVGAWPGFHSPVYLQILNKQERVLLDSHSWRVASYGRSEPFSRWPRYGSWRKSRPFLYVDWTPSRESRWILRTAVTRQDYLIAHGWRLAVVLLPLLVFGKFVLTLDEVRKRRRFDRLVGAMPTLLRQTKAENTLIEKVPEIIAHMLDFDAVALYLLEGDRIVPKEYFSREGLDREAFLHSTDQMPIVKQDNYHESWVIRENRPLLVEEAGSFGTIHPVKFQAAGARPYLIVPIRRRGEGGGTPIGLITAQRYSGVQKEQLDFLQSGAEIVALLLENVRSHEALERIYRKMIQNTRIETLGTVVPFITHNMKTPLVVVESFADSILNDFGSIDHVELQKRVEEIKTQTSLSFQLIQSISVYNSLDNVSASMVNARRGLEKVCGFFGGYFRIKDIELTQRNAAAFEPSIKMEELDFIQVITNLLINADDAFSEMRQRADERIGRNHLKIEVVLESEDDRARISIVDNGPGIKPEHLSRVFELEFTTKDYGTGVGLPYCRRVVEEAGGTINVESSYGEGTSVSILLPTTKGEAG